MFQRDNHFPHTAALPQDIFTSSLCVQTWQLLQHPTSLSGSFRRYILHPLIFTQILQILRKSLWDGKSVTTRNKFADSQPASSPTSSWIHDWDYPIEVGSGAIDNTLVIFVHFEERTILTSRFSKLIVGLDEPTTKTSPELVAEARRNLCRCASHLLLLLLLPPLPLPLLLLLVCFSFSKLLLISSANARTTKKKGKESTRAKMREREKV